ncbi:MAG TPA: serine/threonine-protein kinase [Polyangiales bacterium]|nr:serine/threonine-protein kinase [Polyangiales bacterium]
MGTSPAVSAHALPELIAERYRVEKLLGRGGMAAVYQVYDNATQRVVALKRLLDQAAGDGHVARLFEREYHTLSQLVHPRIIEVYDYQTDEYGPFYTMELLSGGDLRQRSPISWREACRLLCDVCSALALLHSRRFVHRDLTPLNIRCTTDERAKLFDFGSMTQFGRSKHVVGTPPFVAPEALHGQVVDGQTDLFSLGATMYYALTGRHAYAARALTELPDLWRAPPAPPSQLVPGIPAALDELVLELLQLKSTERPPSAAEVMERLSAIGGFEIQEALLVGAAYLSTPTLIGRDDQLAAFSRQLRRTQEGRGTSILVSGGAGTGRSRLLDACALEAKLGGALVLRADARDSGGQRWRAAAALLEQLYEQLPELSSKLIAPRAALLAPVMPALIGRVLPDLQLAAASDAAQSNRAELQSALRDILLEVEQHRLLVLVVDDLDRIDEPSAALLALIAAQARQRRLLILGSVLTEQRSREQRAIALLTSLSDAIRLRNLDAEQNQQLVISLFGDVPNVRWLADRMFGVTRGNPGLLMHVAQHLVDQGACKYAAGTWTLPASLDPTAFTAALRESLDPDLPKSALELARVLVISELDRVSLDECQQLCSHGDAKQLQADVYALAAAGILAVDDDEVGLSRPGWETLLLADLPDAERRPMHRRVAALLEKRGGDPFRWIQHLVSAGETERALELMLHDSASNRVERNNNSAMLFEYVQTLPKRWADTYHSLIAAAEEFRRPLRVKLELQTTLLPFAALTARIERECLLEIGAQLRHDTGLDLLEELKGSVPPEELLGKALGAAQQRFEETPEERRGFPIIEALTMQAQLITLAIAMATRSFDYTLIRMVPSLAPFEALSPALAVVQRNLECTLALIAGRSDRALTQYLEIAKRLDEPDGAGMQPTQRIAIKLSVTWAAGLIEANIGRPSALDRAAAVEHNPLFAVSAQRLRAIWALFQGDRAAAERFRSQTELLQIQNSPPQLFEGATLMQWTFGYAAVGDLLRVKQCLADVEAMTREYPNWQYMLHVARGLYQALRGDYAQAQAEVEKGLEGIRAGENPMYSMASGSLLWTLARQQKYAEVVARGREILAVMEAGQMPAYAVLVPLAFAEANTAEIEAAIAHVSSAIEYLSAENASGVQLGTAYEVRAIVALRAMDAAAFTHYAELCEAQYRIGSAPVLLARHEKLLRAARKAGLIAAPEPAVSDDARQVAAEDMRTIVTTMLSTAQGPEERADRALQLLGKFSKCSAGFLYVLQRQGPILVAQLGSIAPMMDMDGFVTKYLLDALEQRDVTQTEMSATPEPKFLSAITDGARFTPMLLSHPTDHGMSVTGVAMMAVEPNSMFRSPTRLLQALSKGLYDAGDAITQLTHELEAELE